MIRIRLIIGLILVSMQCAHAQQGNWPIPRSAYSTVRTPDKPVKIGPEEWIRTMTDAERIAREQR
jgi:hypothetical protein